MKDDQRVSLMSPCCHEGSSLQEHDSLSGQSVCETHLLRPGNPHKVTYCALRLVWQVYLPSQVCLIVQVSVPKDLVTVMSAVRDGQEVDPQDNNRVLYRFRQTVSTLMSAMMP